MIFSFDKVKQLEDTLTDEAITCSGPKTLDSYIASFIKLPAYVHSVI